MNAESSKQEYLLLFRGTEWDKELSPEEIQQTMTQWMAWFEGLMEQGKVKGGQPLGRSGKVVSGRNGVTVSDGPFAESKEAVGGYFLLQVDGLDEAVEIARQCPALPYGLSVEVRPVAECCAVLERTRAQMAEAQA